MSARFAKIPELFIRDPRITLRDYKVYAALRLHANSDGGQCFPSRETIAELCGFWKTDADGRKVPHVTRISQITANLERLGWLKRDGKGGRLKGEHGKHSIYTLFVEPGSTLPKTDTVEPEEPTKTRKSTVPKTDTVSQSTVPNLVLNGTQFGSQNSGFSQPASGSPPTDQTIDQTIKEITDHERGAIAPVAACAAPPPPVFFQDQEQNQNPETASMTEPTPATQPATAAEPTPATQPATAAEPTPATQRKKPGQRGRKEKRGTLLTLEELPDDWLEWAVAFIEHHAIGDLIDTHQKWLKFRDHYKETEDVKFDWLAIWKSWWRSDLESLKQRPSTRKMLDENRSAKARREAEQRRWEAEREAAERKEREAAERKERDEQRRIELAPTVARVKAYILDADHGMTASDVASALDLSEQDLEAVYRAGLARDPDIVCCSPLLSPTGEWISKAASDAREAAQKASAPTQRTPATDPWAWCEDAPEAAPPKASAPTPDDIEEAMRHVEAAGPRGVEISKISWMAPRALSALCKTGRARMNGAVITAARFDAKNKSAEPKPLDEVLHRFNTSASTTSTVSITCRAVL